MTGSFLQKKRNHILSPVLQIKFPLMGQISSASERFGFFEPAAVFDLHRREIPALTGRPEMILITFFIDYLKAHGRPQSQTCFA